MSFCYGRGVSRSFARCVHVSEFDRGILGRRELPQPGSEASGRYAGYSEAELPGPPPHDGDQAQNLGSVKDIQSHLRHARRTPPPTSTCRSSRRACSKDGRIDATECSEKGGRRKKQIWRFATKWQQTRLEDAACKLLILWWAQQDSNLRLPPCEGGTLPLSYAPLESPLRDSDGFSV